jgi:hypothetical protein
MHPGDVRIPDPIDQSADELPAARDDLVRDLQYRGLDPSGYTRPPRAIERGGADDWYEEAPGNAGEPGGRWHDHEMPWHPPVTTK